AVVAACVRLNRAGFNPIPHVAARRLASLIAASDILERAAGEAGIAEALVIGGDLDWPAGPFRDAASLLESGVLECHGLDRVGFAAYPEGHPLVTAQALEAALGAKLALARRHGLVGALVAGEDARAPIDGLHVFTFGGVARTAAWRRAFR